MKAVRDLLAALLNATLLLAVILVISSIVLVDRVSAFRDETVQVVARALVPQQERLDRIAAGIQSLETRLRDDEGFDAAGLRGNIAELREMLPPMSGIECVTTKVMITQLVDRVGNALVDATRRDGT